MKANVITITSSLELLGTTYDDTHGLSLVASPWLASRSKDYQHCLIQTTQPAWKPVAASNCVKISKRKRHCARLPQAQLGLKAGVIPVLPNRPMLLLALRSDDRRLHEIGVLGAWISYEKKGEKREKER